MDSHWTSKPWAEGGDPGKPGEWRVVGAWTLGYVKLTSSNELPRINKTQSIKGGC